MNEPKRFELSGGDTALDFANTVSWRQPGEGRRDRLETYADLVEWGRHAGVVSDADAAALLGEAERRPGRAAAVLSEAKRVRASIFDSFSAIAGGVPATPDALAGLNASLPSALSRLRLESGAEGVAWGWSAEGELERPLWPVVRAAGELLTSGRLARVRECASETCGWLFVDESRNHSRRWCDMKVCGNRDKVRRYRGRER